MSVEPNSEEYKEAVIRLMDKGKEREGREQATKAYLDIIDVALYEISRRVDQELKRKKIFWKWEW